MIHVNQRQDEQRTAKYEVDSPLQRQPEFQIQQQADEPCRNLDCGITCRNLMPAMSAFSPQNEIAENRNIVIKGNLLLTVEAVRARKINRPTVRQPHDTDVENAT